MLDPYRQATEAFGKGLEVLAGKQRCRHDDGHLNAVHRGNEGGAERHFRLAETDVAADQAVHGAAGAEVGADGFDRGFLVFRLVIGEAGGEFVVEAFLGGQDRC